MASSLLALIDDIATILDDVALLSKVAAKKTAGVLGDDLALNAQQVSGVSADRKLPVVWAVAKGSFINKAILVPMLQSLLPVLMDAVVGLAAGALVLLVVTLGKRVWSRAPG
jgi:predicted DNA repair protein MutK